LSDLFSWSYLPNNLPSWRRFLLVCSSGTFWLLHHGYFLADRPYVPFYEQLNAAMYTRWPTGLPSAQLNGVTGLVRFSSMFLQ